MDFLLENEGKPVPDLASVTSSATQPPAGASGGGEEDDEDVEALKAVYGHKGGVEAQAAAAAADAEAKVCRVWLLSRH
jgi:UBX domain-containing protein 1/4